MQATSNQTLIPHNYTSGYRLFVEILDKKNGDINTLVPPKILLQILSQLSAVDLARAKQVCRYWEHLTRDFAAIDFWDSSSNFPLFRSIEISNSVPPSQIGRSDVADAKTNFAWKGFLDVCHKRQIEVPAYTPVQINNLIELLFEKARVENVNLVNFCTYLSPEIRNQLPTLKLLEIPGLSTDFLARELRKELASSDAVKSIHTLDLQGRDLKALPEEISLFSSLEILDISKNKFSDLPPAICKLTALHTLNLSYNRLTTLPNEFTHLVNLRWLNLAANQFHILPDVFGNFSHLKELHIGGKPPSSDEEIDISDEQAETLDGENIIVVDDEQAAAVEEMTVDILTGAEEPLPQIPSDDDLVELELDENEDVELTELPLSLGDLSALQHLSITNTGVRQLPASFVNLANLVTCNLEFNQLEYLPEGFGNRQSKLEIITLERNNLRELPDSFCRMRSLTSLTLDHNRLNKFPPHFASLLALNELTASYNQLHFLPNGFQYLGVKYLTLMGNLFEEFPRALLEMSEMTHLNLNRNQIATLPDEFHRMTGLTSFSIKDNRITGLPRSLRDLQYNNITSTDQSDRGQTTTSRKRMRLHNFTY